MPDILCNSGGVVVCYFEWVQDLQQFFWGETEVNRAADQVLERAFQQVITRAEHDSVGAADRGDGDRRGEGARRQADPRLVSVIEPLARAPSLCACPGFAAAPQLGRPPGPPPPTSVGWVGEAICIFRSYIVLITTLGAAENFTLCANYQNNTLV